MISGLYFVHFELILELFLKQRRYFQIKCYSCPDLVVDNGEENIHDLQTEPQSTRITTKESSYH